MINKGKDSLGRDMLEFEDMTCTVQTYEPFEQWIERKHGNFLDFMSLKPADKRKLFLLWKWGFSNEQINEDLEGTRRYIMGIIKDASRLREGEKYYWDSVKKFEKDCYETYIRIVLGRKESDPLTTMAKEILT